MIQSVYKYEKIRLTIYVFKMMHSVLSPNVTEESSLRLVLNVSHLRLIDCCDQESSQNLFWGSI